MFGRKKKNKLYRQGDVLLRKIEALPNGLKRKNKILAYGEVTGHKHQFKDKNTIVFSDENGQQYVQVLKDAPLLHEEHAPIEIPEGNYEVKIQEEFDPLVAYKAEQEKIAQAERKKMSRRKVYD